MEVQKSTLSEEHPARLQTMENLAVCYFAVGDVKLAVSEYRKILTLRRGKQREDHPSTIRTMNNLARGLCALEEWERARPLFEKVLSFRRKTPGSEDPMTLVTMNELATVYRAMGQTEKSLPLLQEAAKTLERRQFQDPSSTFYVHAVILCCESLELHEEAAEWRRNWLKAVEAKTGTDSNEYADELSELGMALLRQGKWVEAKRELGRCRDIRDKLGRDTWKTFDVSSMLGAALLGQKKLEDARPLLLDGYLGMQRHDDKVPRKRLFDAADRLVELYIALDNQDEVAKWQAERAKYAEKGPSPREIPP
jgi:tetratricopeptide (TPR) repeat protein